MPTRAELIALKSLEMAADALNRPLPAAKPYDDRFVVKQVKDLRSQLIDARKTLADQLTKMAAEIREALRLVQSSGADELTKTARGINEGMALALGKKADADHGHADLATAAALVKVAARIDEGDKATAAMFAKTGAILTELSKSDDAIARTQSKLSKELLAATEATNKAINGVAALMKKAMEELVGYVNGEVKKLVDRIAQSDDRSVKSGISILLRLSDLDMLIAQLADDLDKRSWKSHDHPKTNKALAELDAFVKALRESIQRRATSVDEEFAEIRRVLAKKAQTEHGPHLSEDAVRKMVEQAKPKDGEPGKSLNPRKDWRAGMEANPFDLVRDKHAVYICLVTTTERPHERSPNWFLLVRDGEDGSGVEIGGWINASSGGGEAPPALPNVVFTAVDYAVSPTDDVVICTDGCIITLPDATVNRKPVRIKRSTSDGVPEVHPSIAGQKVEGEDYRIININLAAPLYYTDGSNWIEL